MAGALPQRLVDNRRGSGSPEAERVGWGALLALVTAFGLFVLIKVIDRRLNPPQEVDGGLARDEGREQTTAYTQLTRE